jgi:hypothetical protein
LAKKVKKSENTLKFKGNQVQFELNVDNQDNLNSALKYIKCNRSGKAITLIEESLAVLKKRNKLIRIADKSEGGWRTIDDYLSDEVATDSEDERRIRAAENRAVKMTKTHKKDTGKQNRKRPAEEAGSFTQVAHDGGNAVNYNATQPFRETGAGASALRNSKANDQCYKCGGYGHWDRECRKTYNGSKFEVCRGPVV